MQPNRTEQAGSSVPRSGGLYLSIAMYMYLATGKNFRICNMGARYSVLTVVGTCITVVGGYMQYTGLPPDLYIDVNVGVMPLELHPTNFVKDGSTKAGST